MIEALQEIAIESGPVFLAWGGFLIGAIFGFVVFTTNFCAMGSISDIMSFGSYNRFRAWMLAAAVAILGAQILDAQGIVSLDASMYLGSSLNWVGNVLGGLLFGIGMIFAGGCASKNLVRVGGGDLRAGVVILVMGLFAYMTIGGLIGPARDLLQRSTAVPLGEELNQGMDSLLVAFAGLDPDVARWGVTAILAGGLILYCFASADFRRSPANILSGVLIGLTVVAGWALTGLAFDEMADNPVNPISLTYVRPSGDFTEYLRRFTADMVPGFGVATVLGAIAGAFVGAVITRKFELRGFADSADTLRNLFGAALMGIGGVTALGCTIGQGVTGLSTLALGSLLTLVFIILGGVIGMKIYEWILMRSA